MNMKDKIIKVGIEHYKAITIIMLLITIVLGVMISRIKIDTDPENMLAEDEPVRVFHDEVKKRFDLSDMVVVGVVNQSNPNGVFNPESLGRIYELTQYAMNELRWEDEKTGEIRGVIEADVMAPSTVDHIGQGGPGVVKFEWLMPEPPETQAQADQIREKAIENPLLKGTVISDDQKAMAIYLPITSKDISHKIYTKLNEKIATFSGSDQFHITGLPVAEDTFGHEMFIQMAISAPLAMLTIFILMLIFFRKLILVISPMIVAMVSVICTMGLMIGLGYPVHIMSSMIPIFLMPIAVVDSIHILSEFFDIYTKQKGKKQSITEVMQNLFTPMLYTSLTSAAGFASLALTPIPPVQVFGVFVAFGIMSAWLCTITFVPAYIMMIKESSLENFGMAAQHGEQSRSPLTKVLEKLGSLTYTAAKPIILALAVIAVISVYGITRIKINDNPVKWFAQGHPIRVADKVLNEHFAGTYMAYLVLEGPSDQSVNEQFTEDLESAVDAKADELKKEFDYTSTAHQLLKARVREFSSKSLTAPELLDKLSELASDKAQAADTDDEFYTWDEFSAFFALEKERLKIFKTPEGLKYIEKLQRHLGSLDVVGKTNAVTQIVKKVNQELISGDSSDYTIPGSVSAVAQNLMQFQNSHRPDDLWHFVTPDYSKANLWIQLSSGDNRDMQKVVKAVNEFFRQNPRSDIKHDWAGLTYINVVWQDKMVWGMLQSFMGSFLVVFIMMTLLFGSPLWGLVCMIPLTITILMIYGLIGFIGKSYDMPVAVLSALTLGMAVDFAIHFLERSRDSYGQTHSWRKSSSEMFGEPARAITRNVLVIAIGFLPLLAAPLIPYKTVGVFLCAIMALSGAITLFVLPAVLRTAEKVLFRNVKQPVKPTCSCVFCIIVTVSVVALIALNLHQYFNASLGTLSWVSGIAIVVMAAGCSFISKRKKCTTTQTRDE